MKKLSVCSCKLVEFECIILYGNKTVFVQTNLNWMNGRCQVPLLAEACWMWMHHFICNRTIFVQAKVNLLSHFSLCQNVNIIQDKKKIECLCMSYMILTIDCGFGRSRMDCRVWILEKFFSDALQWCDHTGREGNKIYCCHNSLSMQEFVPFFLVTIWSDYLTSTTRNEKSLLTKSFLPSVWWGWIQKTV
jgi:hypothetical protein